MSGPHGKLVPLRHVLGTSLVLQCIGLGLLMIAQLIIARVLGAAGFGIFSYATACATAMITLGKFGTDTLVYRHGGQFFSTGDWASFIGLLRRARTLIARASGAACVILVAYAWVLYQQKDDASLSLAIIVAAAAIPIVAFSTLRQAALISIERAPQGLAPEHLGRTIFLILGALTLGMSGFATAHLMVVVNVLSYGVALAFGQYWLLRTPLARSSAPLDPQEGLRWDASARGLLLFSGAFQLVSQFDMLLVGFLLDPKSTGLYAGARQIASVGMLGLFASQLVASPRIAAAYARNDRVALSRVTDVVAIGGAGFTIAYGALLAVAGSFVLGLLGPEFRFANSCLLWLICAQLINAVSGPAGTVAAMLGLHLGAMGVFLGSSVIGCVALLVLIPAYGIDGAAISVVISTAVWCVGLNFLLYRKMGTTVWLGRIRRSESHG